MPPVSRTARKPFDEAVSPVVGTILMVAVTVALAATVLAVLNGFGDDSPQDATDAVFKAQAVDTTGNGKTDVVKITYITGPTGVPDADVVVTVKNATGASLVTTSAGAWSPGDFRIYDTTGSSKGSWFVTVSLVGTTIVDDSISLDE